MRKRLGKKGIEDKLTFLIWEMIVIAMVVIALIVSVRAVATNSTYWKKYHSSDMAMITDLMHTNKGDFVVYYDLKDIHQNFLTKIFFVNNLVLTTFLNSDAVFLYDGLDDKYPQKFIFAKHALINVKTNNLTSDFIVLSKEGNEITMNNYYAPSEIVCSSADTRKLKDDIIISSTALDSNAQIHSKYLETVLQTYGKNGTNELMIFLKSSNVQNPSERVNVLEYDKSRIIQLEKMACLIKRNAVKYGEDSGSQIKFEVKTYSNLEDSNQEFISKKSLYPNWIIIYIDDKMTKEELGTIIADSLNEYYGQ